ncbi:anthranilate phosphoribosyltransferase [Marinihelvus fidelis]|uniref:Anthranilate phosphoribosyltransferase n=1 Tax=Marinihelvus fidelis TaxID=2613842 RepID=A0A5N0T7R7_9GAMM|nr:anthranilate phosphoribosyltransferase [Marinihelvus fidelis]KAA9130821.1 anthranilate phosphoribosyltransferase [Marinihelvus fidelis]
MDIREALAVLAAGDDLETEQMAAVMRQVMTGECDEAQIGAFLMGLRAKGETIDEIAGAVEVMRELATGVPLDDPHAVDIVGTGGDGANLFNVSTASAFVAAAAGARVAKHGNRSVSSKSGSADLLEAAGVRLDLTPEQVRECVDQVGVGFMFAPMHHSAMRHAIGPRKSLGMRTVFNILGPMTNPAGVSRMVIGVYSASLCAPMAEVLGRLGAEHALIVSADDGLDEISIAAPTSVAEYLDGEVEEYVIDAPDFGIERQSLDGLQVEGAADSLALVRAALSGDRSGNAGKAADVVALNAGAAIHVAGLADDIEDGVSWALEVIASGEPLRRLEQLARLTSAFPPAA